MTNYREYNDGNCGWLQYEKEYLLFFLFKCKKWVCVPKPYYDKVSGRLDMMGWNTHITSYDGNLKEFVKKWPDVQKYLAYYDKEQALLVGIAEKYWEVRNKRKGVIKL